MIEKLRKRKMPIIISIIILMFWCIGMFFILSDGIKKSRMIEIQTNREIFYTNKIDSISNGIKIIDDHGRRVDVYGEFSIVHPK